MSKSKTYEQFCSEVNNITNNEYEVVSPTYYNAHTKVKIKHKIDGCGHIWDITSNGFLRGTRCPKCQHRSFKKTTEEFQNEINIIYNNEFKIVSEYVNTKESISIIHIKCGSMFNTSPCVFLRGTRTCNICTQKTKEITISTNLSFKDKVFQLVNDEYTVLSQYDKWDIPILMRHNLCGHEYEIKPTYFLQGTRCKKCTKRKQPLIHNGQKWTTDKFSSKIYELVNKEYTLLSEYVNPKTKILLQHNCEKCGNYKYWTMPYSFLNGARCPVCKKGKVRNSGTFKQEIHNLTNCEYSVIGDFENVSKKICIQHNKCNNSWFITPDNFLRGYRCPKCNGGTLKTHIQFLSEIKLLVGTEYKVMETYKTSRTKMKFYHDICCSTFSMIPDSFLRGTRCPICAESRGEQRVRHWLEEQNNITFISQLTFEDLFGVNNGFLRFDFAIFDSSNNIKLLIEFDGIQHFMFVKGMQTETSFKTLQEHDKRKNDYCKNNHINLLRISYKEIDNIEQILYENIL